MAKRNLNAAGIKLIKGFEGCRLKAYKCPAGVWTIAWGRTKNVYPGMTITQEQADAFFLSDIAHYQDGVEAVIKVPITDNQYAALTSFCYNVGRGALARSTLVRKINAKDPSAHLEFLKWTKANGRVLQGLVRRRKAEQALFLL